MAAAASDVKTLTNIVGEPVTKGRLSGIEFPESRILDLGYLALSGFVEPKSSPDIEVAPLRLAYDHTTGLIELDHSVHPDMLYRNYWYRSSINETMRKHLQAIVSDVLAMGITLDEDDGVLDIGCNDGFLLSQYPRWLRTVGIDPANDLPMVTPSMKHYIHDYFPSKDIFRLGPYKIITAIAMFYDVEDPLAFLEACAEVLSYSGVLVIEVHDAIAMMRNLNFDAVCHEHLTYWSLRSLTVAAGKAGLHIEKWEYNGANGGSIRVYLRHGPPNGNTGLAEAIHQESQISGELQRTFQSRIIDLGKTIREFFHFAEGSVAGYGASTKGNTLIQAFDLGSYIPYIADRDPRKWGLVTARTRIPITSEEAMREQNPKYLFAFPYHFIDAFVQREAQLLSGGTRFIVPIPKLRMVPCEADQPWLA